jgi:hypothetical protein
MMENEISKSGSLSEPEKNFVFWLHATLAEQAGLKAI